MYQALYRKYRPKCFSDVVGQEHITEILRRQVATGKTSHAYLFVGTRGTGKTTCAKILSRALNCLHPVDGDPCNKCDACRGIENGSILDVVEIDAASNNGVDNIRAIRDEAVYTPAEVRRRVYIIDEVHMLSGPAFNALLKILEEPPEHLVFILATTELNKVPATILSRCQHFSFRRISPADIAGRLNYVAGQEGFTLTEGAAALLSRLADGSMRDALSLLDQCASSDTVDEDAVINAVGLMGSINTSKLWELAASGDMAGALELFERIYYGGAEPLSVLRDLLSLTRDMLLARLAPNGSAGLLSGAFSARQLAALCSGVDTPRLLAASETLQEAVDSMKDARDKRTKAELCLIKLMGRLAGTYAEPETFQPAPQAAPKAAPRRAAPAPAGEAPPPPWEEQPPAGSSEDQEAPPPWGDEDAPPEDVWPDMPPEEPVYSRSAPRRQPAPAREAQKSQTVQPAQTSPHPQEVRPSDEAPDEVPSTGGMNAGLWARITDRCNGVVNAGAYNYLVSQDSLVPELVGSGLVLHAKNVFVQMMVNDPAVTSAVSRAASELTGRELTVSVGIGIPEGLTLAPGSAPAPRRRTQKPQESNESHESHEPQPAQPQQTGQPDKLGNLSKFNGVVKFT